MSTSNDRHTKEPQERRFQVVPKNIDSKTKKPGLERLSSKPEFVRVTAKEEADDMWDNVPV